MSDRIDEALVSIDGVVSGFSANAAQRVRKHLATLRAEIADLRACLDSSVDVSTKLAEEQVDAEARGREAGLREAYDDAIEELTSSLDGTPWRDGDVRKVIGRLRSRRDAIRAAREGKADE